MTRRLRARRRPRRALLIAGALLAGLAPPVPLAQPVQAAGALPPAPTTAATTPQAPTPPTIVTLDRVAGPDRYGTNIAVTLRLAPSGGVPVVYIASGTVFADAATAGPLAARAHGAVLLTPPAAMTPAIEAELTRLAPVRVVVVGGTSAVSDAVLARAATLTGVTPVRIAGADRYATSVALAADAFPGPPAAPGAPPSALVDTVFMAAGTNFPDALSIGPVAAITSSPVLLTPPAALLDTTRRELLRLHPAHVVVVGGPSSISAAVATAVAALGPTVERVAGTDRYGTAAAVATRFLPTATTAVLASGLDFPDALVGGPYAATLGAPILLVPPDTIPTVVPARTAVLTARPDQLVALGGQASVRDAVLHELAAWSTGQLTVPPPQVDYPPGYSPYHNDSDMELEIEATQAAYPDLVHIFSIGKSSQGRDIWAAKVTSDVDGPARKPEALFDGLTHSLEHLGLEQTLYLLHVLTHDYSTDPTVKRLVDTRTTYIIFAVNPDGLEYDLTGSPFRDWRKNRQPTTGSSAIGTDLNRNYGYDWGCCGGSSSNPAAWNYRGPAPFSTPEASAVRDFVLSQVVNGVQQIKTNITFHTDGELILWPYGHTKTDIPADMTVDDHSVFVAMGKAMARTNGYRPEQSSDLYITDGDQIDWMYGAERIFSFTFELYPRSGSGAAVYSPPSIVARETARNRAAMLYLLSMTGCPYAAIGKQAQYCTTP